MFTILTWSCRGPLPYPQASPGLLFLAELKPVSDHAAVPPATVLCQRAHVILVLPLRNRALLGVLLLHQSSNPPVFRLRKEAFVQKGLEPPACSHRTRVCYYYIITKAYKERQDAISWCIQEPEAIDHCIDSPHKRGFNSILGGIDPNKQI